MNIPTLPQSIACPENAQLVAPVPLPRSDTASPPPRRRSGGRRAAARRCPRNRAEVVVGVLGAGLWGQCVGPSPPATRKSPLGIVTTGVRPRVVGPAERGPARDMTGRRARPDGPLRSPTSPNSCDPI